MRSSPSREHQRHFVDRRDVLRGDDRFFVDVAEERDLALDVGVEEAVGAAEQDVGLDADRAQVAHAVLRRLGLQLAGGADERHQRQVDVERVVAADVLAELADRLEERQALDVADRAADLDEHDVDVLRGRADASLISLVMCGMTCTVRPR
jgi:type II secretory pathway component PulM